MNVISLKAISYVNPDQFISSDEIENDLAAVYDKLKLPYGRIEMQTGIKTRGVFKNKKPSDISSMAAKKLLNNTHIDKKKIGLLIHASVCRDFLEPSTASVVHDTLGLDPSCLSFDLSNACLGVLSAIEVARDMIASHSIEYALIVTGENSRPLLEQTIKELNQNKDLTRKSIKKYFANFTIGSAGVALLLGKANDGLANIKQTACLSDTSAHHLCQGDGGLDSLVMETDSEELMQRGVALAKENWVKFKEKTSTEFDHFVCHQVGIHHRDFMYKSLELNLDKDHTSFDQFGNTGSAALPLTLALAKEKGKFQEGQRICLLGIGSGLHTQMTEMVWN